MEMDPFFAVTDTTPVVETKPVGDSKPADERDSRKDSSSDDKNDGEDKGTDGDENHDKDKDKDNDKDNDKKDGNGDDDQQRDMLSLFSSANAEISNLLRSKRIRQMDVSSLQSILHDNVSLKERVEKLKRLLGRSAKAQAELKTEIATLKEELGRSRDRVAALNDRVETLANRPTHLDLLEDFGTNFDRALLSVARDDHDHDGGARRQSGGEDPSSAPLSLLDHHRSRDDEGFDDRAAASADAEARAARAETLLAAAERRVVDLEAEVDASRREAGRSRSRAADLRLRLRAAEADRASAAASVRERSAALEEARLEIDLVTRASADANARAAESASAAEDAARGRRLVAELESKVDALQEWALASAEAKRLAAERARELEDRVSRYRDLLSTDHHHDAAAATDRDADAAASSEGRRLWTKSSSLVVGAGAVGTAAVERGDAPVSPTKETVVLRWRFDVVPSDLDVDFGVRKGRSADGDELVPSRHVVGGAGGEVDGAFAVQNACTLVWSNQRSWVRPRAIKYTVEAYAIPS